jgi:hypothetical protein
MWRVWLLRWGRKKPFSLKKIQAKKFQRNRTVPL